MKKKEMIMRSVWAVTLVCVALISMLGLSKIASSPKTYSGTIEILDEKRNTAMGLTAAAAAASTAVAFVPSDATTPIANQIMEVSSYLLIVVCMIFLEKFLLTLFGYVSFAFLIPAACVLGAVYQFVKKEKLKQWAIRLAAFGLVVCVIIPAGVRVGEIVENTHEESIAELTAITIETEEEGQPEKTEETRSEAETEQIQEEEKNWWNRFVGAVKDGAEVVKEKTEEVVITIKEGAGVGLEKAKELFWRFVEGVAVMLVTTCLIPIVTMIAIVKLVGKVFDVRTETVTKKLVPKRKRETEAEETLALTE